jgi:NTP pyrophosphatase (non-canonical NTP hydrolase)
MDSKGSVTYHRWFDLETLLLILSIVRRSSRHMSMHNSSVPATNTQLTDNVATIDQLKRVVTEFVEEREWNRFHTPKNLAMSIAIETAELMEHFQWTNPESPTKPIGNESPVAQELADLFAYTLRLAEVLGVDLSQALVAKMSLNRIKYPVGQEYLPKDLGRPDGLEKAKNP